MKWRCESDTYDSSYRRIYGSERLCNLLVILCFETKKKISIVSSLELVNNSATIKITLCDLQFHILYDVLYYFLGDNT